MKERPILFSAPMVRAILDGRKTQTRRVLKPQPEPIPFGWGLQGRRGAYTQWGRHVRDRLCALAFCPYGQPGDRLWVKETFFPAHQHRHEPKFAAVVPEYIYATDYADRPDVVRPHWWTPAIFCTRAASRITLEIMDLRVERLNEISEEDARAEGAYPPPAGTDDDGAHYDAGSFRDGYRALWQSINGPDSWAANPWVWVVEFRREEP